MSPGKKPKRSPASTAGRVRMMRSTSPACRARTAIATASHDLPVPAGPMPKVTTLSAIASTYAFSTQMWVKPTSEMSFLYGNHLLKSGLGRITENTPANQGVVVFSMSDVPLGFGVAAKSTQDCRKLDASSIVAFHQADVGEYLRAEDDMVQGKKE